VTGKSAGVPSLKMHTAAVSSLDHQTEHKRASHRSRVQADAQDGAYLTTATHQYPADCTKTAKKIRFSRFKAGPLIAQ
jgi:hypothetical protein